MMRPPALSGGRAAGVAVQAPCLRLRQQLWHLSAAHSRIVLGAGKAATHFTWCGHQHRSAQGPSGGHQWENTLLHQNTVCGHSAP